MTFLGDDLLNEHCISYVFTAPYFVPKPSGAVVEQGTQYRTPIAIILKAGGVHFSAAVNHAET